MRFQENPTYFTDSDTTFRLTSLPPVVPFIPSCKLDSQTDAFINCSIVESDLSPYQAQNVQKFNFSPLSSPPLSSNNNNNGPFTKLSQLFWKSKSKNSVGSTNSSENSSSLNNEDSRSQSSSHSDTQFQSAQNLENELSINNYYNVDSPNSHSYYNAPSFVTFSTCGRRRHSIATSKTDGYLVPIKTNRKNVPKPVLSLKNIDDVTEVEIHTPSSLSTDLFSSGSTASTSRFNYNNNGQCSSNGSIRTVQEGKEPPIIYTGLRRSFNENNECEPYCAYCITSSTSLSPRARTRKLYAMDIGILYCKECFFSQRAHKQILSMLETLKVGQDGKKIDITHESYEMKEMEVEERGGKLHRAKIQVVILSHHFLEKLRHEGAAKKKLTPLNRILKTKKVLGVLLNVPHDEIVQGFQQYLLQVSEWKTLSFKTSSKVDVEFVGEFLSEVDKMYRDELSRGLNFSILPKKVSGSEKLGIILKKGLDEGEEITIELRRGRHREKLTQVAFSNPYTALIKIPPEFAGQYKSCLVEVSVFINQIKIGTKLVKYETTGQLQSSSNQIQKYSETLPGFRKLLDEHISSELIKSFNSFEDFQLNDSLEILNEALLTQNELFPTVLHFAATYNLPSTASAFLSQKNTFSATQVKNIENKTPAQIAQDLNYDENFISILSSNPSNSDDETLSVFDEINIMRSFYERQSKLRETDSKENESENSGILEIMDKNEGECSVLYANLCANEEEGGGEIFSNEALETTIVVTNEENLEKDEIPISQVTNGAHAENALYVNDSFNNDNTNSDASCYENEQIEQNSTNFSLNPHSTPQASNLNTETPENDGKSKLKIKTRSELLLTYDVPPPPSRIHLTVQNPHLRNFQNSQTQKFLKLTNANGQYCEICQNTSENCTNCSNFAKNVINEYDSPRPSLLDYCIPPVAKPIVASKPILNKTQPEEPIFMSKGEEELYGADGYILIEPKEAPKSGGEASSAKSVKNPNPAVERVLNQILNSQKMSHSHPHLKSKSEQSNIISTNLTSTPNSTSCISQSVPIKKEVEVERSQRELIELLEQFKSNVYNIREVELLWEGWKERNGESLSGRTREREIKEIQKEYRRIQERAKRERKGSRIQRLMSIIPGNKRKISGNLEQNSNSSSTSTLTPNTPSSTPCPIRRQEEFPELPYPKTIFSNGSESSYSHSESGSSSGGNSTSEPDFEQNLNSYVEPSPPKIIQISSNGNDNNNDNYMPPRPPKKISTSSNNSVFTQQISPNNNMLDSTQIFNGENKDERESHIYATANPKLKNEIFRDDPPPTPPRNIKKFEPAAPFNFIDYNAKSRGVIANIQNSSTISTPNGQDGGLKCRTKSFYENESK